MLISVVSADDANDDPAASFADGVRLFEAQEYASAAAAFDVAVKAAPTNDEYHYWRGKAYGRRAEHAGWFDAIKFAKLTRESFEQAVRNAATQRAPGGLLVLEHAARVAPPAPAGLVITRTVKSGDSALTFYS